MFCFRECIICIISPSQAWVSVTVVVLLLLFLGYQVVIVFVMNTIVFIYVPPHHQVCHMCLFCSHDYTVISCCCFDCCFCCCFLYSSSSSTVCHVCLFCNHDYTGIKLFLFWLLLLFFMFLIIISVSCVCSAAMTTRVSEACNHQQPNSQPSLSTLLYYKIRTLPKSQRARGLSSYHKFMYTNLDQSSKNLKQTSASRLNLKFKIFTKVSFRISTKI